MRKIVVIALFGAASVASAASSMDARTLARGGAGILTPDYYGVQNNPALLNKFDEEEQFGFSLNFAVVAADPDGAIDTVDTIESRIDDLEGYQEPEQREANAKELELALREMSGKNLNVTAGAGLAIAVPNSWTPMALVVSQEARVAAGLRYNNADTAYLQDVADGTQIFIADNLKSEVTSSAVSVRNIGLAAGRVIEGDMFGLAGTYDFGATLKLQNIILADYVVNPGEFEADDFSEDQYMEEHSGFNVDLGMNTQFNDRYSAGVTITNLVPQSYKGKNNTKYKMSPVMTVGGLYDRGWFKAEANLDLTKDNGYALVDDSQFASVGMEMGNRHSQFRLGYRHDMKGEGSMATIGFGLSPFDLVNLDLAAMKGSGDAYGVALQLGAKF